MILISLSVEKYVLSCWFGATTLSSDLLVSNELYITILKNYACIALARVFVAIYLIKHSDNITFINKKFKMLLLTNSHSTEA
jgi:hypothetical protein